MMIVVHVEACQVLTSSAKFAEVEACLHSYIVANYFTNPHNPIAFLEPDTVYPINYSGNPYLCEHLLYAHFNETSNPQAGKNGVILEVHVYQLSQESAATEMLDEADTPASQMWELPCQDFEGYWESLQFEDNLKSTLLSYISAMIAFGSSNVSSVDIICNRLVVLHGPPGTGKTTLCKSLAQKAAIRYSKKYKNSLFIEINSHSLFSKWFSESGKLVMKAFENIRENIQDEETFVFVMIDEVESLSAARTIALQGNEPSDALRVVNAVLTQIDSLSKHKNVVVLTTTNITEGLDPAFLDRADVAMHVGLPSAAARYGILRSCIVALMKAKYISEQVVLTIQTAPVNDKLVAIAKATEGMSGRALRKLPLKAYAFYLEGRSQYTLDEFLEALYLVATDTKFQIHKNTNMEKAK